MKPFTTFDTALKWIEQQTCYGPPLVLGTEAEEDMIGCIEVRYIAEELVCADGYRIKPHVRRALFGPDFDSGWTCWAS